MGVGKCRSILSFLFGAVPDSNRLEFDQMIRKTNLRRGKITATAFLCLETVFFAVSLVTGKRIFMMQPGKYYTALYLAMMAAMAVFLAVFVRLEKTGSGSGSATWVAGTAFAAFILFWCAEKSLLDQFSSGKIASYSIAAICVAVVAVYPPKFILPVFGAAEVFFVVMMPHFQKSSALSANNSWNSVYFVVLAGVISAAMYKSRINDFNNDRIIQKKNEELERINLELTETNRALEKLSVTDGLADIYNRSYFDRSIRAESDQCRASSCPLSLIMLDIDYFKEFNDHYGHQAGDDCIRRVAAVLTSCVKRSNDIVARYGGDEFAVILPNTGLEGAVSIAKQIRIGVESLSIPHGYSDTAPFLTISLGVDTMEPSETSVSVSDFIHRVDRALYEAKKYRDRVMAAQPELS
jgi:diguanylate cyclase (GGDEF)-like protein